MVAPGPVEGWLSEPQPRSPPPGGQTPMSYKPSDLTINTDGVHVSGLG
jgi:hypothetical protein